MIQAFRQKRILLTTNHHTIKSRKKQLKLKGKVASGKRKRVAKVSSNSSESEEDQVEATVPKMENTTTKKSSEKEQNKLCKNKKRK